MRGAIGPDGQIPCLLAAATHGESVVIAERLVGAKTNEAPEFAPLLRGLAARTARIDALDWARVAITHQIEQVGHRRRERRTLRVLDAPAGLGFPGAAQVFLIERYTTRTVGKQMARYALEVRPASTKLDSIFTTSSASAS